MWEVILKRRTLVHDSLLKAYKNLGYEYVNLGPVLGSVSHHLVFNLGRDELGDLIMDILEEHERRDTLERFDLEGFRFGMQNPNMGILVQMFDHIVNQYFFNEVKNLVGKNDNLMLAKKVITEGRRNSDVILIYKFVDGSPEIYRNVVRESEKIQKEIDDRRY
tara:strand:+ start:619 stop:1107 length:489 start_codon:yes stop_codon:yes gene_type:complete